MGKRDSVAPFIKSLPERITKEVEENRAGWNRHTLKRKIKFCPLEQLRWLPFYVVITGNRRMLQYCVLESRVCL